MTRVSRCSAYGQPRPKAPWAVTVRCARACTVRYKGSETSVTIRALDRLCRWRPTLAVRHTSGARGAYTWEDEMPGKRTGQRWSGGQLAGCLALLTLLL